MYVCSKDKNNFHHNIVRIMYSLCIFLKHVSILITIMDNTEISYIPPCVYICKVIKMTFDTAAENKYNTNITL